MAEISIREYCSLCSSRALVGSFDFQRVAARVSSSAFQHASRGDLRRRSQAGFSLVELLAVLAIMAIVTAMTVPAINGIKDAQNVANAADTISGTLQQARAYAMAHNTYVWVGFYEERADAGSPTNAAPPYSGKGRVIIGMVASADGTSIGSSALPAARLVQIDRLNRLQNVHLTDLTAPTVTTGGTGSVTSLSARPNEAFADSTTGEPFGISSDSSDVTSDPFTLGSYTFYKTVCFNPSGEATINGDTSFRRLAEIGICPTHGDALSKSVADAAVVQFTGIGGAVQTYRN
jgi:prepilin-type N-terminal cleavage/methylation domain-containing protein